MSTQNEIIPLMEGYGGGGALGATKACGLPAYVFLIFTLECIGGPYKMAHKYVVHISTE